LTITVGDESFDVTIDEQANTLEDIRAAINSATGNTGVQATLLKGVEGTRLVFTSKTTGADGAIKVAASGGDGGLEQLNFDPDGDMNLEEKQLARNSLARLSGIDVESSANVISDAVEGLTITLIKAEADKKI